MEATRQMVMEGVQKVPSSDLKKLTSKKLTDFVIKTPRGERADEYVRGLRDGDRV